MILSVLWPHKALKLQPHALCGHNELTIILKLINVNLTYHINRLMFQLSKNIILKYIMCPSEDE